MKGITVSLALANFHTLLPRKQDKLGLELEDTKHIKKTLL